jgi:Bacterial regulatory proteins, tetR family
MTTYVTCSDMTARMVTSERETLRDAHKDLTRERILEAVVECLNDEKREDLTIEDVAGKAGVTKRTIYRHFATREDLLKAAWPAMQRRVGLPGGGFVTSADQVATVALTLFPAFDKLAGAVRASAFSRAGRELRLAVNEQRKSGFLASVKDARPDLDKYELLRLAATVQLLNSAFAWAVMRDFWGLSGEESGRAVSEATRLLLGMDAKKSSRSLPVTKNAKPKKKEAAP